MVLVDQQLKAAEVAPREVNPAELGRIIFDAHLSGLPHESGYSFLEHAEDPDYGIALSSIGETQIVELDAGAQQRIRYVINGGLATRQFFFGDELLPATKEDVTENTLELGAVASTIAKGTVNLSPSWL